MTKTVKLSRRYTVGSETFDEVRLREPKFGDLMTLGEPMEVQKGVVIRYNEIISAYLERLVEYPALGAVREIDLRDGLAIHSEVLGFFLEARRPVGSETNSSSGSGGAPATLPI